MAAQALVESLLGSGLSVHKVDLVEIWRRPTHTLCPSEQFGPVGVRTVAIQDLYLCA